MIKITRRFDFCAGHRLYRSDWTDQQNNTVFGLCANPNGHGHNYTLEVSVFGPIDKDTGMVMNLRELKETITERVINQVDHKNLNEDVSWMKGVIPTTEMFAERVWVQIEDTLRAVAPKVVLDEIVLHETPNNKVTKNRAMT